MTLIPMTAAATLPSRDLKTAVAICAVIVAALLLAWRSPSELPAASPVSTSEPADSAFSLDTAMRLAGTQVPPELDSFYFFAMIEAAPEAQDIAELGKKLQAASAERDYLGIAGPDPERNRRTLLAALAAHRSEDLSGMILIYVGPDPQRAEVSAAAAAAKIELRFVAYPEVVPPI
ncbi:hypothetical protein [Nevskia sp.]|uniref:hypothetical protein n=1 Tax=Nevskia sp. TaxID=1929292 RepID=UPI0025DD8C5C|nr:hypothetical protein [Nevskia sp.]